jgi:hypothetical protein
VTDVETTFFYSSPLRERTWKALDNVRDVYGIRQLLLDDRAHAIHVEYDASHLTEGDVAALLRDAGIDLRERVWDE